MKLDEALQLLESTYPKMNECKKHLQNALKNLGDLLNKCTESNLKKLYEIEYNAYFPGLSLAVVDTVSALHKANPKLDLSYLFEIVNDLSCRGRARESLNAFSMIANSCPKQMKKENIAYLKKINSDYLEICSHTIEEKTKSSFLSRLPISCCKREVNIQETIEANINALNYSDSMLQ